ncbi:uncharacterized protein LOC126982521 isoform X2 [Eriocheir sinensis]|uniref:uncharacterized protein LOC126982521 isoform X2 n=1 Tax=Eriocheir sinensis TaxID=95602 RepID=UPI0021C801FE|nr:uncharacterized protein LOC126982521 isoform X2 [Eriocheir sinensis]
MVHRKSTYRLTYRDYAPQVRKTVWQENNTFRLRRREEEWSHHTIKDSDSDCECDESEEEDHAEGLAARGPGVGSLSGPRHRLANSQEQIQQQATLPSQPAGPPPHVPRLRFSPEQSPRIYDQQRTSDSADEGAGREDGTTTGHPGGDGGSEADISEVHAAGGQTVGPRNRTRSPSVQLGVMKSGSQAREYDLIPGIVVGHFFIMRVCIQILLYHSKSPIII